MALENLPDKLVIISRLALLGEIYPAIRTIAYRCDDDGALNLIRYYLDREPIEYDWDSIKTVYDKLNAIGAYMIDNLELECVYSNAPMNSKSISLSGFIYGRREYDMESYNQ